MEYISQHEFKYWENQLMQEHRYNSPLPVIDVIITPRTTIYLRPYLRDKCRAFFHANSHRREVSIRISREDYDYFERERLSDNGIYNTSLYDLEKARTMPPHLGACMGTVINDDLPKDAEIVKIKIQKEVKINTNLIEL